MARNNEIGHPERRYRGFATVFLALFIAISMIPGVSACEFYSVELVKPIANNTNTLDDIPPISMNATGTCWGFNVTAYIDGVDWGTLLHLSINFTEGSSGYNETALDFGEHEVYVYVQNETTNATSEKLTFTIHENITTCELLDTLTPAIGRNLWLMNNLSCPSFTTKLWNTYNLYGQGYTLSDLITPFISQLASGSIQNLNFDNVSIDGGGQDDFGIVFRYGYNGLTTALVHNINITNSIITNVNTNGGGISGKNTDVNVTYCSLNNVNVSCNSHSCAGVFGRITHTSEINNIHADNVNVNCINDDICSGFIGIVEGNANGYINNSYIKDVTITPTNIDYNIAGFLAKAEYGNNFIIENSYVENLILNSNAGSDNIGGFLGKVGNLTVRNCYVKNPYIDCSEISVVCAGFVGNIEKGIIRDSYVNGGNVYGDVDGSVNLAGFVGVMGAWSWPLSNIDISNCWTNITVHGGKISGFSGGVSSGIVNQCYTSSILNVTNSSNPAWGFANWGGKNANITNSYTTADMIGGNSHVGFIGYFGGGNAGIHNTYTAVTTDSIITDIMSTPDTYSSNYWDIEITEFNGSETAALGKTTEEMTTQSTYSGWDFGSIWTLPVQYETYPYFQYQTENYPYARPIFDVISPENITYSHSNINLDISTLNTVISWSYNLNGNISAFTPNTTIIANEGSNWITVTGTNSVSDTWTEDIIYFTVDSTAPIITMINPLNNITYNDTEQVINATADKTISQWWYYLNGGSKTFFTPGDLIDAQEGYNSLDVYAKDILNNEGDTSIFFFVETPGVLFPLTGNFVMCDGDFLVTRTIENITTNGVTNETVTWERIFCSNGCGGSILALGGAACLESAITQMLVVLFLTIALIIFIRAAIIR